MTPDPAQRRILLAFLAFALIFEVALAPNLPEATVDPNYTVVEFGLGDVIRGGFEGAVKLGCAGIELTPITCADAAPVIGAGVAFAGCAGLTYATVGLAAGPCAASLGLATGIGAGVSMFKGECHLDGRIWNECITSGWGASKNLVESARNGETSLTDVAWATFEVGTTAIPVYLGSGVKAAGAAKTAGAKSGGSPSIFDSVLNPSQAGKAGTPTKFDDVMKNIPETRPTGLKGMTLEDFGSKGLSKTGAGDVGLGTRLKDGIKGVASNTKTALSGGSGKVGDDLAKGGANLQRNAFTKSGQTPIPKAVKFKGGKGGIGTVKADAIKYKAPKGIKPKAQFYGGGAIKHTGKSLRYTPVRFAAKAPLPAFSALTGVQATRCAVSCSPEGTTGPRGDDATDPFAPPLAPGECTSNCGTPDGTACAGDLDCDGIPDSSDPDDDGDGRPDDGGDVVLRVLSPSMLEGKRFAHDESFNVRLLMEGSRGISKWSAIISNGRVDVKLDGESLATPESTITRDIGPVHDDHDHDMMNSADHRLPAGKYAIAIAADDGRGSTGEVTVRFEVADAQGRVPDEPPSSCSGDINGNGVSDCIDEVTDTLVQTPEPKKANIFAVIAGLIALLGGLGYAGFRLVKG